MENILYLSVIGLTGLTGFAVGGLIIMTISRKGAV